MIFFVILLDIGAVPTVRYLSFSVRYWSCSDSAVFVVFLLDIELFRQCGICCFSIRFLNCSDSAVFVAFLLDIGAVPTVWYLLFFC